MDDGLKGLGRRSALALAGAGVSGVATIATMLIASRSLSSTGAGKFFVAISLFAIVQGLASFGAETSLQYFVPTLTRASAKRLIWQVCAIAAALGAIVGIIALLTADGFGDLLAKGESSGGGAADMVRAVALVLPFAGLYEVTMGALRAGDQVLVGVVLDRIIRPIAQVVAMLATAIAGGGSNAAFYAWVVPNVGAVLIALLLLTRLNLRNVANRTEEITQRAFWGFTAPRAVARVAQTLTQRLDVIILAAVYPLEEAGIYGTVSRCMIAGVFISTAVRQVVQPQLRRLIVEGNHSAVKTMYGTTTTWLVLVTWPAYLAMITHAPLVMSAFGPSYVRGATALVLLCLAMLIASACGMVDVVLLMLGRSWLSTINVLVALVLNVALNLILAPKYGMEGSAVAWVVAILATNVVPLYQTSRVGLHPGGRALNTAMVAGLVCIALPLGVERAVVGTAFAPFAVTFVVALLVYVGVLYVQRQEMLLDRLVADLKMPRRRMVARG